jgi:hypothetical protein
MLTVFCTWKVNGRRRYRKYCCKGKDDGAEEERRRSKSEFE